MSNDRQPTAAAGRMKLVTMPELSRFNDMRVVVGGTYGWLVGRKRQSG